MKFKVEIVSGINKGRVLILDEDKAEQFVEHNKVRILQVITADAPPESTPNLVEVHTEVSGSLEPEAPTPEAAGDELDDEERCVALTAKGERCKNGCVAEGYCKTHVPKIVDAEAHLVKE